MLLFLYGLTTVTAPFNRVAHFPMICKITFVVPSCFHTCIYLFMVVPLSHLSIPVLVPYCPNYHSFMMNFGVWQRKRSSFLQEEFPFLQSYSFPIYVSNFLVILSFYKPWIGYITFLDFCLINEAEVDVFLEFSCFLYDLVNVGNLITDSFASFIFLFFPLEDNCFTVLCWPLPYINMNQPQIYTCPLLPRPLSHPIPSTGFSQNSGLSSLCHTADSHLLSILHMVMYVSMLLSQFVLPSSSPTVSISLFLIVCISVAALQIGSSVPSF